MGLTVILCKHTEIGKKVELSPAARGSQEAVLTQPRDHLLADPCMVATDRIMPSGSVAFLLWRFEREEKGGKRL